MTNEEFIKNVSFDGEEWADIIGYEKRYIVSTYGRVAALYWEITTYPRGKKQIINREPHIMKLTPFTKTKYYYVMFRKAGKRFKYSVHRLVAIAFIPNPNNLPQVDHIDGDRQNNIVSNLRWCDASGNMANSITQERVDKGRHNINFPYRIKIAQIKDGNTVYLYNSIYDTRKNGFNPASVNKCVNGKLQTYKGFKWIRTENKDNASNYPKDK